MRVCLRTEREGSSCFDGGGSEIDALRFAQLMVAVECCKATP